jgi:hypothetical protein
MRNFSPGLDFECPKAISSQLSPISRGRKVGEGSVCTTGPSKDENISVEKECLFGKADIFFSIFEVYAIFTTQCRCFKGDNVKAVQNVKF